MQVASNDWFPVNSAQAWHVLLLHSPVPTCHLPLHLAPFPCPFSAACQSRVDIGFHFQERPGTNDDEAARQISVSAMSITSLSLPHVACLLFTPCHLATSQRVFCQFVVLGDINRINQWEQRTRARILTASTKKNPHRKQRKPKKREKLKENSIRIRSKERREEELG